MRRSKYGYLLLALLVVTGLAGTLTPTSLTSKERKFAANQLKYTKSELLKSVTELSGAQLNFKPGDDQWSIKECVFHIALSERELWHRLDAGMNQTLNPEIHSLRKLNDRQIQRFADDRIETAEKPGECSKAFLTIDAALESFKNQRTDHIKYVRTTTEDLRNHMARVPAGWFDCYQVCLLMSAHTQHHIKQIAEIKADPNFPSR